MNTCCESEEMPANPVSQFSAVNEHISVNEDVYLNSSSMENVMCQLAYSGLSVNK